MAGYKSKKKTYTLDFEGREDFDGLQVEAKGLSIDAYLKVSRLAEGEDAQGLEDLLANFAKALVSWNLEDEDDNPVPANFEGVKSQDMDFIMVLIGEWMKAIAGVAAPLESDSNSGATSPAPSLPMEAL